MCEKVPFFEILQRMREGIEMNSHPKDPGEEVLLLGNSRKVHFEEPFLGCWASSHVSLT